MVRRWSCVNECNIVIKPFKRFLKVYKKEIFKASVNYKRFAIKFSKFKRKALARWKHKTNWLIYTSIIKTWSNDYIFNAQMVRYQYLNFALSDTMYVYDLNYLKFSRFNIFNDAMITSPVVKRVYCYPFKFMLPQVSKHFLNYTILKVHSLVHPKNLTSILPLYLGAGNSLFQVTVDTNFMFNFENFFLHLLELQIIVITEAYKLLILLNCFISLR